jgi:hypothetical protein
LLFSLTPPHFAKIKGWLSRERFAGLFLAGDLPGQPVIFRLYRHKTTVSQAPSCGIDYGL